MGESVAQHPPLHYLKADSTAALDIPQGGHCALRKDEDTHLWFSIILGLLLIVPGSDVFPRFFHMREIVYIF